MGDYLTIDISSTINSLINISMFFRNSALSQVVLQNVHVEALVAKVVAFMGRSVMRVSDLGFSLL